MDPLPPWFLQTWQDSPKGVCQARSLPRRPLQINPVKIFLLQINVWRKQMSETRRKYDEEFKKNAVRLSYASNKPVVEIARDLDISDAILYRWRQKYTAQGDKTRYATLEEEVKALKLENAELKIERDMLKKASAYFASLHK